MGTSGAYTQSALGSGVDMERGARFWGGAVVWFDGWAVGVSAPQTGTGASSVDEGAGATTAGGSKVAWVSAVEENDPAKV